MNHILLRTNAAEYHPGDTVYGAVYLNIVNPTAGCGVRLKFRGYEHFVYGLGGVDEHQIPQFSDRKDYIDCSDIILYKSSSPLSLGCYVFPFKFSLLHEIPGSFSAGGSADVRWEARVEYWVHAEMIGAESVEVQEPVVVLQKICSPQQGKVAEHKVKYMFGLLNKSFSITARLLESVHRSLNYAHLRLLIANQSSERVNSINIKLKQEILLCTKYSSSVPLIEGPKICRIDRKIWIQPELGNTTIWEHYIQDDQGSILNKGMDKVKIPLFTDTKDAVPPTTLGAHVQCKYNIEATAHLQNGQSCSITLPVSCVLPQENQQWTNFNLPDWVNSKLTVMEVFSPFNVQPHILNGEPFAGLPPFQQF